MAYTKLFNSIVTSTIWLETDRTRIVWITMLALADANGEVQASVPGLAHVAGVPVDDCRAALDKFLAPDPDSRTKDDEGRRIEPIDGGWHLLNHAKYRAMASGDDRNAKAAERQRRHREKLKRNVTVTHSNASVTLSNGQSHTPSHAEADSEAEEKALKPQIPPSGGVKARKPRQAPARDAVIDCLATLDGTPLSQVTRSNWTTAAVKAASIRSVCPDVTPEEIHRRARNYRKYYPDTRISLTAGAMEKHWGRCDAFNAQTEFSEAPLIPKDLRT